MADLRTLVAGLVLSAFLAGSGMVAAHDEKVPSDELLVKLLAIFMMPLN